MKTVGPRDHNGWQHHGLVEWIEGKDAYLSVVFSWNVRRALEHTRLLRGAGYTVHIGGPAIAYDPSPFHGLAWIGEEINVLPRHNPNATFTSRGCIRKCQFCAVPTIEGNLRELTDWDPRPIVCDNNFLACSMVHIERAVDRLKPLEQIDFNQGLDARLLSRAHADLLRGLDMRCVRLAWDHMGEEAAVRRAVGYLRQAGFPKTKIRIYCLIGWNDTPEDALYRLTESAKLTGNNCSPMRYQPLDSTRRNAYVGPNWTHRELTRYMRYWSNMHHLGSIPFAEFDNEAAHLRQCRARAAVVAAQEAQ